MYQLLKTKSSQRNVGPQKWPVFLVATGILLTGLFLGSVKNVEATVFSENFDDLEIGQIAGQNNWFTADAFSGEVTSTLSVSGYSHGSTAGGSKHHFASSTTGWIQFSVQWACINNNTGIVALQQSSTVKVAINRDNNTIWSDGQSYSAACGNWHTIKLVFDTDTDLLDVFLNGTERLSDLPFSAGADYFDTIHLYANTNPVFYIDDISGSMDFVSDEEPGPTAPVCQLSPSSPEPGATTTYPGGIFTATGTYSSIVTDAVNDLYFKIRFSYATNSAAYWDFSFPIYATSTASSTYNIYGTLPNGEFITSYWCDYAWEADCSLPIYQGNTLMPGIGSTCEYHETEISGIASSSVIVNVSFTDYGTATVPVLTGEQSDWFNNWISRFFSLTSRFPLNYISAFYTWIEEFGSTTTPVREIAAFSLPEMCVNGDDCYTPSATGSAIIMPNLDDVDIDIPGGSSENAGSLISNLIKLTIVISFLMASFFWVVGPFIGGSAPGLSAEDRERNAGVLGE